MTPLVGKTLTDDAGVTWVVETVWKNCEDRYAIVKRLENVIKVFPAPVYPGLQTQIDTLKLRTEVLEAEVLRLKFPDK